MKIDHIAIAVNDVEESAKVYQQALGADHVEFETVESEGVKVAIIELENGRIELMQPTNDSSPIKKFLEKFNKYGEGLYQPKLLATNNKKRINSAGNMINVFGFGYSLGKGKNDNKEYNKFKKINYASGACLFTSRKILEKIGYFDSFLFAYHDDLELGWKGAQLNIQSFYVPEIIVYHAESFSFKWSPKKYYLLERNRWYCILTHYSKSTFYKLLPSLLLVEIFVFVFYLKKGMLSSKIKANFDIIKNWKHINQKYNEIQKFRTISDKVLVKSFNDEMYVPKVISAEVYNNIFNNFIKKLSIFAKKFI